eukprot:539618-Prymnesium_polylepis.1
MPNVPRGLDVWRMITRGCMRRCLLGRTHGRMRGRTHGRMRDVLRGWGGVRAVTGWLMFMYAIKARAVCTGPHLVEDEEQEDVRVGARVGAR